MFGCKKISTPDEDSKLIFGQWAYSYNSGGISGGGGSTTFKDDSWVEFSEKGVAAVFFFYHSLLSPFCAVVRPGQEFFGIISLPSSVFI